MKLTFTTTTKIFLRGKQVKQTDNTNKTLKKTPLQMWQDRQSLSPACHSPSHCVLRKKNRGRKKRGRRQQNQDYKVNINFVRGDMPLPDHEAEEAVILNNNPQLDCTRDIRMSPIKVKR